jgi:hypothetical protein
MIRITSIHVMGAALLGALAWSNTGARAGTLDLRTSTPSVKVTPPKVQVTPQPSPPKETLGLNFSRTKIQYQQQTTGARNIVKGNSSHKR